MNILECVQFIGSTFQAYPILIPIGMGLVGAFWFKITSDGEGF